MINVIVNVRLLNLAQARKLALNRCHRLRTWRQLVAEKL